MFLPKNSLSITTRIVKLIHKWSSIIEENEVENIWNPRLATNSKENQKIFERAVLYLILGLQHLFQNLNI